MSKYQPGQIWKYHTRPGEETSRLVVCQVDNEPGHGSIVHVNVRNVVIKVPFSPAGTITELAHLPLTEKAMDKSVTELETDSAAIPCIQEEYQRWRDAFENGTGGVFPLPVFHMLQVIESSPGPVQVIDHEVVVFTGGGGSGDEDDYPSPFESQDELDQDP